VIQLKTLRMLDLFSGIGGFTLAAKWAGIETAAFCEIDPFCQKVLRKHWPEIPIIDDIYKLNTNYLDKIGVLSETIDIICGGFPCQPYSIAGKRRGEKDDRHIWPEMLRVIKELRPRWVLGENVANFVDMGLDNALTDLEACNYEAWAVVLPACAVDAPNRRNRVFIVAHSDKQRCTAGQNETGMVGKTPAEGPKTGAWVLRHFRGRSGRIWTAPESCFDRVDYGIPSELDRLRALGNAVNPRQVYPILKAIVDIENRTIQSKKMFTDRV